MAHTPPTNSPRLALARQTRVLADVDAAANVVALAAPPRAPSSRPSTPRRPSISRVHARATTSRALLSSQRRPRARSHVPTPFAARRRRPARGGVVPRVVPVDPARDPSGSGWERAVGSLFLFGQGVGIAAYCLLQKGLVRPQAGGAAGCGAPAATSGTAARPSTPSASRRRTPSWRRRATTSSAWPRSTTRCRR